MYCSASARRAAACGLAGEPLDLGDPRVGQQVPVPDHLVHDVGLGRVERRARVAQVLRRVEDAVGERAVELLQRHEPGRGVEREPGQALQAGGHLVELRHAILGQRQRGLRVAERAAGEPVVLRGELAADGAPDLVLGLGVLDARHRHPRAPGERGGGDLVAPPAVLRVVCAGVVVGQMDLDPVRALGHGCVELRLLEHGPAPYPRSGRDNKCVSAHHGNFVACGRPGSQASCAAAAGWSPIVRRSRARRRPLDARGQAPRRPAGGGRA